MDRCSPIFEFPAAENSVAFLASSFPTAGNSMISNNLDSIEFSAVGELDERKSIEFSAVGKLDARKAIEFSVVGKLDGNEAIESHRVLRCRKTRCEQSYRVLRCRKNQRDLWLSVPVFWICIRSNTIEFCNKQHFLGERFIWLRSVLFLKMATWAVTGRKSINILKYKFNLKGNCLFL